MLCGISDTFPCYKLPSIKLLYMYLAFTLLLTGKIDKNTEPWGGRTGGGLATLGLLEESLLSGGRYFQRVITFRHLR